MKAFVTGGTGFVGSHLVDALLARGDDVAVLLRSPAKAADLAARGVTLVRGDLHDPAALAEGVRGADVVYHVAALTGALDEAEFLRANRDGTRHVLEAAARGGAAPRFVLVSSMAAGGPALRGRPSTGEEPPRPVTMYGRSKLASEELVRAASLPWVIVRPPAVYGPRDADNFPALFQVAARGFAPVFGTGAMELSLVHVGDLADALVRAGTAPGLEGRTFYANHPEIVTSAELVRAVGRTLGRDVRVLRLPRPVVAAALAATGGWAALTRQRTILRPDKIHEFFQEAWTGDPSPFVAATGWTPRFDLAAGLADTLAWIRATSRRG